MDWSNPPAPGKQFASADLATVGGRKRAQGAQRGRPKGHTNASTQSFLDRMEELRSLGLDCDPIQILMEVAIGKKMVKKPGTTGTEPNDYDMVPLVGGYDKQNNPMDVDAATKAKAAAELCSYIYPKRKAIEVTGAEGTAITFAVMADTSPLPSDELPAGITIEALPASGDDSSDKLLPHETTPE